MSEARSADGGWDDSPQVRRIVLLGASNVTYAWPMLVRTLARSFPEPVDLLAAHGHGRSYGLKSQVALRTLPGLIDCGLWKALAERNRPDFQPLALLTDVGNDLIYGPPVEQILQWVETCLRRLAERGFALTLITIPNDSVARLTLWKYVATRAVFFFGKGPDWPTMQRMVTQLDDGLKALATKYGAATMEPLGEWYALDPIHIERRCRAEAWTRYLSLWPDVSPIVAECPSVAASVPLWRMRPERRWILSREQWTRQPVMVQPERLRVSLY